MTVPGPWEAVILVMGAYRLVRLGGWDEFPLAAKVRAWVTGEEWVQGEKPTLPGKTPDTDINEVRVAYRRPVLAHLIHCPFVLAGGSASPSGSPGRRSTAGR